MAPVSLTVDTQHGPVVGFHDSHPLRLTSSALDSESSPPRPDGARRSPVAKWLGIPYATAQRFRRPTAPEPWTEPRQCFEFGSQFPQPPSNTELLLSRLPGFLLRTHIPTSEGSHFVNVFAPGDVHQGEDLPVLVWVYGGALNNGDAGRFFYDPTELVRDSAARDQRCIVVTLNYRTNIFGFCASQDLVEEDPHGLAGNYGLYDVVSALEWVQSNIRLFGGSPERVTAFGQSAGAFLISHLLVSGRRLFQRAICQSGAANTMMLRPVDKAYPAYDPILTSLGVDPTTSSPSARLAALRAAPASQLLDLHKATHSLSGLSLALEPEAGGRGTWTRDTMRRLERGERDEWVREVVMGVTEDEGTVFANMLGLVSPAAFDAYVSQFPASIQPRIRNAYLPSSPPGSGPGPHPAEGSVPLTHLPGARLLADQIFVHPVLAQAEALSSGSGSGSESEGTRARVWLYRLRTGPSSIRAHPAGAQLGAFHSIDLPCVFNSRSLWEGDAAKGSEGRAREVRGDEATAREVGTRWVAFATTGEPDPAWPPFDPSSPSQLVFAHDGATSVEPLDDTLVRGKRLELYFEGHEDEGEGEEVLGTADE
ncbi:carboxylesterase [Rhodotorula diobovata]|uniref:Carboxylesterase n=1 Tax=Rhodotorula diobovata TaxID=5288 RepID=A0A5C5FN18_9BASI|nr:carboxylesterase [Rhodotorula diobovata]